MINDLVDDSLKTDIHEDVELGVDLGKYQNEVARKNVLTMHLQNVLMIIGFSKLLYLVRQSESYGLMVEMIFATIDQTFAFLVFFLLWVCLYTLLFWNMHVEIGDEANPEEDPYANLWQFFRYFIWSW